MARCDRCKATWPTLPGEEQDHACPRCGWSADRELAAVAERARRAEAEERECCDFCGKPLEDGWRVFGNGGGWARARVLSQIGRRWWSTCSNRCAERIEAWHRDERRRVPRLVGRETVAAALGAAEA